MAKDGSNVPETPKPKARGPWKTPRRFKTPRTLVRWDRMKDERLLVLIYKETRTCKEKELDFERIARTFGKGCTAGAIQQHIAKMEKALNQGTSIYAKGEEQIEEPAVGQGDSSKVEPLATGPGSRKRKNVKDNNAAKARDDEQKLSEAVSKYTRSGIKQKQNNNSKEDPFATEDEDEQASDADAKGHHDLSFKKQKTRGQSRMAELSAIASMVEDESEDDMPLAELLRRTRPAIPMSSEAIEPRKGNSRFSNVKVEDGHESEALVLRGGSIATGGIISAEAESSPSFSGLSSTGTDFVEEVLSLPTARQKKWKRAARHENKALAAAEAARFAYLDDPEHYGGPYAPKGPTLSGPFHRSYPPGLSDEEYEEDEAPVVRRRRQLSPGQQAGLVEMRASLASHYDSQSASGLVTRSPNPNSHIVGLDIGTRGLRAVTARLGLHDDSGAVSSPESSSPPEAPAVSLPLRLSAPDAPAQAAVVDVDSDVEFHPLAVHRVENPNGGLEARPLDPFAGWPGLTLADGSVIANPNVLVGGLAAMGTHPPSPTPAEQSPVFSLPVPPVGLTEPTLSFGADSGYFSAAWEEMGLGGEDGNEGGNGAGTGDDGLQFFNESWE